jgi:hypothetical protein
LKDGKRLGAHVARNNSFHLEVSDTPGSLNPCTLNRVQVLRVVMGREVTGVGIENDETPGSSKTWIDLTGQIRTL